MDIALLFVTAAESIDSDDLSLAWSLFGIVAVLLIGFVILLAILTILRRIRRSGRSSGATDAPTPEVDAWSEAGRRLPPYSDGPTDAGS